MNVYDDRYYGLTRRLMISIGLWPYQNLRYRKLCWVLVFLVHVPGITLQYMTFLTHQYSLKLLIEVMSFNILLYLYIIKYNTVYLNSTSVRLLLEQIKYDCNALTDTQEIEIIQKYASRGRLYTIYGGRISDADFEDIHSLEKKIDMLRSFSETAENRFQKEKTNSRIQSIQYLDYIIQAAKVFVYLGTVAFLLSLCMPDILNFIAPLNESRQRQLPCPVECFFDQQKYFYVLMIFITVIATLGMTTFMATETLFMVFIQHACGLFAIASYRLTHAFEDCKNISVIVAKLSRAIRIHERSLQFIRFLNSCFSVSYTCLSAFGVASLVANMLRLFQAIESNIVSQMFASALYVVAHFCYVFWVNYFGQDLSDHSDLIFDDTYSAQWYTAPVHVQKLLLFVLQRSARTCVIGTFKNLMIASMEGFASLVSLSMSYFTVLYSFRM